MNEGGSNATINSAPIEIRASSHVIVRRALMSDDDESNVLRWPQEAKATNLDFSNKLSIFFSVVRHRHSVLKLT